MLEDYLDPGKKVLDIGTGSGILAIAAAKLGASEVISLRLLFWEYITNRKMASWWASSSSYIYNEEKRLNGLRAQRINFLVKNASDIPRAGKVLLDRLWLHGHGDIVVSKSGQLLEKTTFDGSVWQPCRFDFAAGAAGAAAAP